MGEWTRENQEQARGESNALIRAMVEEIDRAWGEIARLKTELADAIKAHEEADERAERASRGLSEAEARAYIRIADTLRRAAADHAERARGASMEWHAIAQTACIDAANALLKMARGDIPPDVRKVDPPDPDRPVDASLEARADRRKAAQILIEEIGAPGPETFEETATRAVAEIRRLRAVGASRPKPRVTNAANQRATMEAAVVLGEEPPTQPPRRERCKPIAGPWTNGVMTYDERGLMLASASKTTEGVVVCVNRPHLSAEVFHTATEYEAMTAIRERLATWCDVTALTIPEAP